MSKQAKKRPKPVNPIPCECWALIDDDGPIHPYWCSLDEKRVAVWRGSGLRVIRVRIVPVVAKAKRRKVKP